MRLRAEEAGGMAGSGHGTWYVLAPGRGMLQSLCLLRGSTSEPDKVPGVSSAPGGSADTHGSPPRARLPELESRAPYHGAGKDSQALVAFEKV